jgi:hypothetical protein
MVVMVKLERRPGRQLAILSLVLWFGAVTAGRLIAYTAAYTMYP